MLVDSYFYPGFFDAQAKLDISRGPLAFIIKNYILRCDGIPRLIGYSEQGQNSYAYFATEAGQFLGAIWYERLGRDETYKLYSPSTEYGAISGYNVTQYAASTKSAYIISAITKDRASGRSPVKTAKHAANHTFYTMMQSILYRHVRAMRREPVPPVTLTLEDTAHITSILLNGDSPLTMPAHVRAKVEHIHKFMNLKTDTQTGWANHVNEMFGREKWVVIPREFVDGSKVWTVGAIQLPPDALADFITRYDDIIHLAPRVQITQPFMTYRSMADLPDELIAVMTMQKHMLKTMHMHFVRGTDEMVPYTGSTTEVVWPEMNSAIYDVAGSTVAYLLDK